MCQKLFNKYKTHDFKWSNQSYTSLAMSIFNQLCGLIFLNPHTMSPRERCLIIIIPELCNGARQMILMKMLLTLIYANLIQIFC